jgi:hypothetical protein
MRRWPSKEEFSHKEDKRSISFESEKTYYIQKLKDTGLARLDTTEFRVELERKNKEASRQKMTTDEEEERKLEGS